METAKKRTSKQVETLMQCAHCKHLWIAKIGKEPKKFYQCWSCKKRTPYEPDTHELQRNITLPK